MRAVPPFCTGVVGGALMACRRTDLGDMGSASPACPRWWEPSAGR